MTNLIPREVFVVVVILSGLAPIPPESSHPLADSLKLSNPADITYTEGETGNEILWNLTVDEPLASMIGYYIKYRIYINQGEMTEEIWQNDEVIRVNVDGRTSGTYNYTIVVWSSIDDIATDTVFVSVLPSPIRIVLFVGSLGFLGVIALFSILILKGYIRRIN